MALLTPQVATKTGLTPVYTAPTVSDTISPDTGLIYHVKCGATGTTVTLDDGGTTPGGSAAVDPAIVIPANQERFIQIPQSFMNPATGLIAVTMSSIATVTSALLRS